MDQDTAINDSEFPIQQAEIGPWQFSLQRLFAWTFISAVLCFVGVKVGWSYAAIAFPTCAALATARSVKQGTTRAVATFFFFTGPMLLFVGVPWVRKISGCGRNTLRGEIDSLHASCLMFNVKYGAYPPNFCDVQAVRKFWERAFPYSQEEPPADLDPAEALVFWLSGFSPDRTKPITGLGVRAPLFPFYSPRLQGTYPHQTYFPDRDGMNKPLIYFDVSRTYLKPPQYEKLTPYVFSGSGQSPPTFQIICAGVDNDYGRGGNFPLDANHSAADEDNLTNFNPGRLGDAGP